MTKMPKEFKYEPKIHALLALTLLLGVSYVSFVALTLRHTLERQKIEEKVSALTADLSQMEFDFLSKESGINSELALSYGFVEPTNIIIARKSGSITALALPDEARAR